VYNKEKSFSFCFLMYFFLYNNKKYIFLLYQERNATFFHFDSELNNKRKEKRNCDCDVDISR
jgi:hypothetical protein